MENILDYRRKIAKRRQQISVVFFDSCFIVPSISSGVFLSKSFAIFANEPAGWLPWKRDLPLFEQISIIAHAQQTCLSS